MTFVPGLFVAGTFVLLGHSSLEHLSLGHMSLGHLSPGHSSLGHVFEILLNYKISEVDFIRQELTNAIDWSSLEHDN